MNEHGVERPPRLMLSPDDFRDKPKFFREIVEWSKWLGRLRNSFPKVQTFSEAINPASVAANSEAVEVFTVAGLTTSDIVTVNKPSNTAGLDIVQCWVSATDSLSIKFRNHTGSPIDAGSEIYLISAVRR